MIQIRGCLTFDRGRRRGERDGEKANIEEYEEKTISQLLKLPLKLAGRASENSCQCCSCEDFGLAGIKRCALKHYLAKMCGFPIE